MLVLYYFNWVGTPEEFEEFVGRIKSMCDGVEGIDLKEVFIPSSEWNFAALLDTVSFEKALELYRTYNQKYGPLPQMPSAKLELLMTFKEAGLSK